MRVLIVEEKNISEHYVASTLESDVLKEAIVRLVNELMYVFEQLVDAFLVNNDIVFIQRLSV